MRIFTCRLLLPPLIFLASFSSAAGEPASTNEPLPEAPAPKLTPEQIRHLRELIQALKSDSFAQRTRASEELFALGRLAIEPLEYGLKSDDSETRLRCTEMLIAMRGRGFLGIGLREDNENVQGDDENEENWQAMPHVIVSAVMTSNDQSFKDLGFTRPMPAETADLRSGDKILSVNDQPIRGTKDLMREVILVGPARAAILTVERDGSKSRVPVVLTRNRNPDGVAAPPVDLESELPPVKPKNEEKAEEKKVAEQPAGIDDLPAEPVAK